MNQNDSKILGTVYAALLTLGAASLERIMKENKMDRRTVQWALWQLRCEEQGGLYTLPAQMLPSGWDAS